MCQHGCSQVSDEGESLGVQVPEHCIRFPAADEADGVGVDLATKECHGPSCTEAAGVDVLSGETEVREGVCGRMEDRGEVSGCEGGTAVAADVGAQWCGSRATSLTEGDTPLGEGIDGACGGVTTVGMANDLAPFAIFLVVESEGDVRCTVQVRFGGSGGVEFMVPYGEGDIAQAQGVVVRSTAVFARAQQEEEGDPDHLHGSGEFGRGVGIDGSGGMVDDLDR